jgi:serine/threonine protein kinase
MPEIALTHPPKYPVKLAGYDIIGRLPEGKRMWALLYMTQSASTGERRVIKISDLNRVNAEFGALEEFNCPQVVKACLKDELTITSWDNDVKKIPQTAFFMMEFLEGETLGDIVGRHDQETITSPIIDPKEAVDQMFKICEALLPFWLKGHLHGDIKPLNIMALPGRGWVLFDFVLGALYEHDFSKDRIGMTAGYMPHDIFGKKPDYKTDLFAIGITMARTILGLKFKRYFKQFSESLSFYDYRGGFFDFYSHDPFSSPLMPQPLQDFIKTVSNYDPEKRISDPNLFLKELGEVRRKLFAG